MDHSSEKITPLMQQYFQIKAQFPDTLLFFQVGDFYELFFNDAQLAAAHLAIALTKRGKNKGEDIPLCGVPVHALNHYLTKLIKGGFRVALCQQLSKPQPGVVVQRGVTQVFTPATLTDTSMLDEKSASYLLSFFPGKDSWGLLFGELLTAQLYATTIPVQATRMVEAELIRFFPDEIIIPRPGTMGSIGSHDTYFKKLGYYTSFVDDIPSHENIFTLQLDKKSQEKLIAHPIINRNLQAFYSYLHKNQPKALDQFKTIQFYQPEDYVILDPSTQRNLEIIKNSHDGTTKSTLFAVLDHAKTPMGSRTIKKWLQRPLVQKSAILQRQELVGSLSSQVSVLQQMGQLLGKLADLERIIGRIALRRALLNDYLALKESLAVMPDIKSTLQTYCATGLGQTLQEKIADFAPLLQLLDSSLQNDGSAQQIIKHGFDHQLDKLRDLLNNGQHEILQLEQREIARTGISSLKISFTNISGYYIEITNTHSEKIPSEYIHQQTLANRKRFVTQELKALEQDLYRAQNNLESIETAVFDHVKKEVETYLPQLRLVTQSLAYLDALFGFATAAYEYNYQAPTFSDNRSITITAGRHPIVEQSGTGSFIPNDTALTDTQSTWIITGPNMGGKSTYLRQVALTSIMAQCGSFVPAQRAQLTILDRIFTRIGSGDNLAEGKSTFLVEMEETASICSQATENSLVILDEVGRGTSTYDGMALAQAIVEYLHEKIRARCLFATHYHELTQLSGVMPGIVNYHTACKKTADGIIFLHKIIPGSAGSSFGLEVAKLANLPQAIITRSAQILTTLNTQPLSQHKLFTPAATAPCDHNQQIAQLQSQLEQIKSIDCSNITPKQALDILWELTQGKRY